MNQNELIAIIDLAWQDIKTLEPKAIGVIVITVNRSGDDEVTTMMGSTLPPKVVRYAVKRLNESWGKPGAPDSDIIELTSRKIV